MRNYSRGYYYDAKRQGLLEEVGLCPPDAMRCKAHRARFSNRRAGRYLSPVGTPPGGYLDVSENFGAEFVGTFWLVFAVLGTAHDGGGLARVGVGWIGVAFAAGLAVMTMAYAVGGISGGHFNPAVSLGLAIAGRFDWKDLIGYWVAQIVGGADRSDHRLRHRLVGHRLCRGRLCLERL